MTRTLLEQTMLRHADPAKLVIDSTGTAVSAFLMYRGRPWVSIGVLFGSSAVGSRVAASADLDALAASSRGQWMLVQAAPINLILRSAGLAAVLVGLHRHRTRPALAGVALIVLGRMAGAAEVGSSGFQCFRVRRANQRHHAAASRPGGQSDQTTNFTGPDEPLSKGVGTR